MIPSLIFFFASWSQTLGAGAVLHDPVVFPRRRDDLLRFEHVVRDRLLDVHILARLNGPDRLERMVEVRSRDRHGIDRLVVEHLPDVGVRLRTLLARRLDRLQTAVDDRLIDVAERRDLDVGHLQVGVDVRLAPAVEPHDRQSDRVVRALQVARLERDRQCHRAHDEMPAIHCVHRCLLMIRGRTHRLRVLFVRLGGLARENPG